MPFAFLLASRAGIDVRVAGSGNVGAAKRPSGTRAWRAVIVMAPNVAKGSLAVMLASVHARGVTLTAVAAAAAVVGHIVPIWLRFTAAKGGRGPAGVFAVLAPVATRLASRCPLRACGSPRYVSLGSIAAGRGVPPAAWLAGEPRRW